MRNTVVLSAILLAMLIASPLFVSVASATPAEDGENLEKLIGRSLVEDGLATRAGVIPMLPQSCPPFYLKDEYGKIIDPTVEEDVNRPVSFRRTCDGAACHDVSTITKGYHFQMGADEMYDVPPRGEAEPVDKGPGYFGKWRLFEQRELAPFDFTDPSAIDMTPFDWVMELGVFHPGGGPAEYDRAARRYDQVQAQDPGIAMTYKGDYFGAKWHESGVAGPDCLICHLDTFEYSERAKQLKSMNFKWAGTVASGLATIEGAIKDGDIPRLTYNKNVFGSDGKVHLKIRKPTDNNCMFCHHMLGVQKRGSTWHDNFMQDMHTQQGLTCVDCHQGDIRHNLAKGDSSSMHIRDDLDGSIMSCEECHESEEFGAPDYDHPGIPPLHFERMACQACHISKRPLHAASVVDTLTGKNIKLANRLDQDDVQNFKYGAYWSKTEFTNLQAPAKPVTAAELKAASNLRIGPDDEIWTLIAGSKPLPGSLEAIKKAGPKTVQEMITQDGKAEINTAFKRKLMLLALQRTVTEEKVEVTCMYQGQSYRVYGDELQEIASKLNTPRVGYVGEHPVSWGYHEEDGKKILYPEWYQLGVFWAYDDGTQIRPLHIADMKAAWDYIGGDEWKLYYLPAKPADGEAVDMPDPAKASARDIVDATMAKISSYDDSERVRLTVHDDNQDVWPEANTDEEIGLMAWSLVRHVKRLPKPELYYIKGESAYKVTVKDVKDPYAGSLKKSEAIPPGQPCIAVYQHELDEATKEWKLKQIRMMNMFSTTVEKLDTAANPQLASLATKLPWTISHGVQSGHASLGANGCTDCHSMNSDLFFSKAIVDPFGPDGLPVTVPLHEKLGFSRGAVALSAWREGFLRPIVPWAVLLVLAAIAIHFALIGAKTGDGEDNIDTLRFSLPERMTHLVLMSSVAYLGATGFCFLLGASDPLGQMARDIHAIAGYAAAISFAIVALIWARNMLPAKGDMHWLLHLGGYLSTDKTKHYPAGKFNAGQKILFWKVVVIMAVLAVTGIMMALNKGKSFPMQQIVYTIHDVAGLFMILLLLGHIYLGAVVNPHSIRSIFGGMVSSVWAKRHHPDWKPNR